MQIEMKAVSSFAISSIGYDPESKTLRVQMTGSGNKPGKEYDYPNVGPEVAHEFINSPVEGSHGKHLARHIRPKYGITAQKA
jgi:KTSC domain-containing protein